MEKKRYTALVVAGRELVTFKPDELALAQTLAKKEWWPVWGCTGWDIEHTAVEVLAPGIGFACVRMFITISRETTQSAAQAASEEVLDRAFQLGENVQRTRDDFRRFQEMARLTVEVKE